MSKIKEPKGNQKGRIPNYTDVMPKKKGKGNYMSISDSSSGITQVIYD